MALTIQDVHKGSSARGIFPDIRLLVKDVAADASYPAGGYPVTPAQFGLTSILAIIACDTTDGVKVVYNASTAKLMFYVSGGSGAKLAETSGATVSGSTSRLLVLGV